MKQLNPKVLRGFCVALFALVLLVFVLPASAQREDSVLDEYEREAAFDQGMGPRRGKKFDRRRSERRGPEGMRDRQERMKKRMEKFDRFFSRFGELHQSTQNPHKAIAMAAIGIKEAYKRRGSPEKATAELRSLLEKVKDQKARNTILFVIRQIFQENKNVEMFLKVSQQIIKENVSFVENHSRHRERD